MRFSENPERNTAIIWFVIAACSFILAIILAALTFSSKLSFVRFFPPLILACLSFLGILSGLIHLLSARKVDALTGGDFLLHWSYRYGDITPYLDDEIKRRNKKKILILLSCVVVLAIGVLLSFTATTVDYAAIGEYAVLLILAIVILYKGLPAMGYGTTGVTEFYLGKSSALFGGRFHNWDEKGGGLENVQFREGKPSLLLVSYKASARGKVVDLRIPVPFRREQEVKDLLT
ncbi:MAG: hypothetical protein A4E35_00646 [Methanoregula sp. PtaU1.Bin051]|nr:MAG: hypothetical protein A4E35_00646 [Methanoregula sp. PtaU1.Bin051]